MHTRMVLAYIYTYSHAQQMIGGVWGERGEKGEERHRENERDRERDRKRDRERGRKYREKNREEMSEEYRGRKTKRKRQRERGNERERENVKAHAATPNVIRMPFCVVFTLAYMCTLMSEGQRGIDVRVYMSDICIIFIHVSKCTCLCL